MRAAAAMDVRLASACRSLSGFPSTSSTSARQVQGSCRGVVMAKEVLLSRSLGVYPSFTSRVLPHPLSSVRFLSLRSFCVETSSVAGSKRRARGPIMAAKKAAEGDSQEDSPYKDTVDLPRTKFSMKANSVTREPEIQKLWEQKQVLQKLQETNTGEIYTLHDGPPYANGELHMGHALNKILKDFINRYQLLQGRKVKYVPGWDCHGLPIELKVLQSMDENARKELTPIKLRKKAAQFALKTVELQRKSFKRFGVWGDWENPYLTLSPEYEAAQIGVFGQMLLNGHIYRGRKPVHWSPSSGTALAEAELEYPEGHTSRSIYAVFKITHLSDSFPKELTPLLPTLGVAIWTTTPWTIPGNAAVAVNDKLIYAVVEVQPNSAAEGQSGDSVKSDKAKKRTGSALADPEIKHLVVAEDLVKTLQSKLGVNLEIKGTFPGSALELCKYKHPLWERESPVVIGGDYITTETGTGLVHTAPGHGHEDYITGQKYGLPLLSPVDDEGNFTEEAGKYAGLNVLGDGNLAMVEALDENKALLLEEPYVHKYPYDWRTKKPTIFRATEQWFASVEGFRQAALQAISTVQWFPAQGEKRITSMTVGRSDWCISRQRSWGVPIPCFYHVDTGEPLMNEETISHIQSIVAQKGSDAWFYMSNEELLPEKYRGEASKYRRGMDTMDVWFDSGSSWAAVVDKREGLHWPADLYLEGSDQHRGWFQSSLLTSVATKGGAPYKKVVTHGFLLDQKGNKMSKSLGNVLDPKTVIEGGKNAKEEPGYGADVLRLWVSSVDYAGDVMMGPQIIRQTSDVYRKIRGTLRYLLSNLHDYTPDMAVDYENLPDVDKYALYQLSTIVDGASESFDGFQFYRVFQLVQRFAVVDLSNFYLDVAKDRLYTGGTDSYTRRSCQTVLSALLLSLVRVIAPIVPHTAEDVWQNLPFQYEGSRGVVAETVFEAAWPKMEENWRSLSQTDVKFWTVLLSVRDEVNRVLEQARIGKLIGASLEAKVYLHTCDEELSRRLQAMTGSAEGVDSLNRLFITSQAEVVSKSDGEALNLPFTGSSVLEGYGDLWVGVARADGAKCERCWNYTLAVGTLDHPTLCERCNGVVKIQPPARKTPIAV
ncbi:hypothetical protein R1sor_003826 [Riccia sorocarpa]|uniref:isoleucine--tRNA ligase n=1 Tax=Riccia sorocarpa TaxID=122646 RepID=A0ABD3H8W4_9MARC